MTRKTFTLCALGAAVLTAMLAPAIVYAQSDSTSAAQFVSMVCAHQDAVTYLILLVGGASVISWFKNSLMPKLPAPAQTVVNFFALNWRTILSDLKILAPALLVLFLVPIVAGCATGSNSAAADVSTLETGLLVAESAAGIYESLPSADPKIVADIEAADKVANDSLAAAKATAATGASVDSTALSAAVGALQAIIPAIQ